MPGDSGGVGRCRFNARCLAAATADACGEMAPQSREQSTLHGADRPPGSSALLQTPAHLPPAGGQPGGESLRQGSTMQHADVNELEIGRSVL